MRAVATTPPALGWGNSLKIFLGGNRMIWLVLPAFVFFLIFFVLPTLSLFAIAFNNPVAGVVHLTGDFTLKNFERFFSRSLYYGAAIRSIGLATLVSFITLVLGYPLAF